MIKIENTVLPSPEQWMATILGARNAMNSWARSDSKIINYALEKEEPCPGVTALVNKPCEPYFSMGPNDHELMMKLAKAGSVHAKYRRMLPVIVNITAPLYWFKEFDTYKIGTTANSCSTMHKIHAKEFTLEDFSCERLRKRPLTKLEDTIEELNYWRDIYNNGGMDDNYDGTARVYEPKDKEAWEQMIQLLPSSYNQMRTIELNYEVLVGMYHDRKNHKLLEWRELCSWVKSLPYSELIIGEGEKKDEP